MLRKLDKPSFKQFLVPAACVTFLVYLCKYLLEQPLSEALQSRSELLIAAMTATGVLLVLGCLYSYLFRARIQSYLCAALLLFGIGFAYHFFFMDFSQYVILSFLGLAAGVAVYAVYRRINILSKGLYGLCAAAIVLLLAANLLFGQANYGARLWINFGQIGFQPGELVKILLIVLGASSFGNPVRGGIYCAMSLLSCGVLLLLHDLGGAVAIFALFVLMTYLLFDNRILSLGIIAGAVLALTVALQRLEYAAERFASWGHAMENTQSHQQRDYIIGLLMGGFRGLGTEDHGIYTKVFGADNDGALAGVMAVLGVPTVLITMGAYGILAVQPAVNRSVYTSSFLIHGQMGMYIAVHVLLNYLGAVDLLPFTGVVAPVISSGGTGAVCFGILLGLGAAALHPHLNYYKEE